MVQQSAVSAVIYMNSKYTWGWQSCFVKHPRQSDIILEKKRQAKADAEYHAKYNLDRWHELQKEIDRCFANFWRAKDLYDLTGNKDHLVTMNCNKCSIEHLMQEQQLCWEASH